MANKIIILALFFIYIPLGFGSVQGGGSSVSVATLDQLMDSEKEPVFNNTVSDSSIEHKDPIHKKATFYVAVIIMFSLSLLAFFFWKRHKKNSGPLSSVLARRFLIEQISWHSYGPKQGLSVVKVGKEFVLLGVSPNNINFLCKLDELKRMYEEESQYEREAFDNLVSEELSRIKTPHPA